MDTLMISANAACVRARLASVGTFIRTYKKYISGKKINTQTMMLRKYTLCAVSSSSNTGGVKIFLTRDIVERSLS
jgi:hypothetical protein